LSSLAASVTLIRIEDFARSVEYRIDRLRSELAAIGETVMVDTVTSRAIWRAVRDAAALSVGETDAVWRVSVRPSRGPEVLAALEQSIGARGFLDWGGGLVWLAAPPSEAAHAAVAAAAQAAGGVWALLRAPEPLRAIVDVIPPEPRPLAAITRRVKTAFDPYRILNPGRMYAGL
jgi:glycolate oxidase FAD binding subunit